MVSITETSPFGLVSVKGVTAPNNNKGNKMNTQKEITCDEQVEARMDSCLEDLRAMLNPNRDDARLIDDGTLERVIEVSDITFRFEEAEGETAPEIFDEYEDEIRQEVYESFESYGLSFDVVHTEDAGESYVRYQICWGGPTEEFRFFCDFNRKPYKVEFWFLDWFDGASRDCTHRPEIALLVEALGFNDWLKDNNDFWSVEA